MVLMSFWSVTCGLVTDPWNDPVYYIISIQYYMKYCNCYWTVWIPNMIKLRKHFWHGCLSCGYPIGMSDASPKNLLSHTFFNTHTKIVVYYISCNLKCVVFFTTSGSSRARFWSWNSKPCYTKLLKACMMAHWHWISCRCLVGINTWGYWSSHHSRVQYWLPLQLVTFNPVNNRF